jgi:hypothetical protein
VLGGVAPLEVVVAQLLVGHALVQARRPRRAKTASSRRDAVVEPGLRLASLSAHFSTKQAASQSSFSTSSASALIPQTVAPVMAYTACVGLTGAVLVTRNTPSGR